MTEAAARGFGGYFRRRWRGQAALAVLLWRDMLLFGTLINLTTFTLAVASAQSGYPLPVSLGIYILPVPYNLFLFSSVWRVARTEPKATAFARGLALIWLCIFLVI